LDMDRVNFASLVSHLIRQQTDLPAANEERAKLLAAKAEAAYNGYWHADQLCVSCMVTRQQRRDCSTLCSATLFFFFIRWKRIDPTYTLNEKGKHSGEDEYVAGIARSVQCFWS